MRRIELVLAAVARLKEGATDRDLIDRLRTDTAFSKLDFDAVLDPLRFVGRSPEQVVTVLAEVDPIRRRYPHLTGQQADVDV